MYTARTYILQNNSSSLGFEKPPRSSLPTWEVLPRCYAHANETQFREFPRNIRRRHAPGITTAHRRVGDILVRRFHTSMIAGERFSDFSNIPSTYGSRILRTENIRAPPRSPGACFACYRLPFTFILSVLTGGKRASGPSSGLPYASSRPTLFRSLLLSNHRSFPFAVPVYLHFQRRINGLAVDC